ncbi:MAG: FAD-dependent oxidoreductase [Armatimonadota bacterium]
MRNKLFFSFILFMICVPVYAVGQDNFDDIRRTDVLVVGATPCGISAAIAASRSGSDVILAEMTTHIGGMMTSGLGRTDIGPRNTVGGIFREFINNIHAYYTDTYGAESQQVKDCSNGYFYEPSVSERILNKMVDAEKRVKVRYNYKPSGVFIYRDRVHGVNFYDTKRKKTIQVRANVVIDATYEGDIAAMAGVPYRIGRESREETGEAYAGVLYLDHLTRMVLPGSTGEGDRRVQAYNYRLCLTKDPNNRVITGKPDNYNRNEYLQVLESVKNGRIKRIDDVLNIEKVPNGKSDTNNMPLSLISTDLPEENFDYPEASYEQREKIIKRHKDYILGLIYFLQNDPEMPEQLRENCREWGFAKDEYQDNNNFPRQLYVREARRIWGLYSFSAHDAVLAPGMLRTPVHFDSIACGGYSIDSHATRKKEPGQDTELEGFFWLSGITQPYQIPYRVMIPQKVDGLIVPGAASATHLGFGTLRMEPVWMAMGQAAGTAAHMADVLYLEPREVPVNRLQSILVENHQVLTTFNDIQGPTDDVSDRAWQAMQFFGTRGFFDSYDAKPLDTLTRGMAARWIMNCIKIGDFMPAYGPFVKHMGGGSDESSLAQMEKLKICQTGDPSAILTEGELSLWLTNIEPWLDGAWGDAWVKRVRSKDSITIEPDPAGSCELVTKARFCEELFSKFRSVTTAVIDKELSESDR